jgi:hypothetical protein
MKGWMEKDFVVGRKGEALVALAAEPRRGHEAASNVFQINLKSWKMAAYKRCLRQNYHLDHWLSST